MAVDRRDAIETIRDFLGKKYPLSEPISGGIVYSDEESQKEVAEYRTDNSATLQEQAILVIYVKGKSQLWSIRIPSDDLYPIEATPIQDEFKEAIGKMKIQGCIMITSHKKVKGKTLILKIEQKSLGQGFAVQKFIEECSLVDLNYEPRYMENEAVEIPSVADPEHQTGY